MPIRQVLENQGFQLKRKTAKEFSTACPFCGGTDRFCVWPEDNRYWCRQCQAKGDDIELLKRMQGLNFQEAAEAVGRPVEKAHSSKEPSAVYNYTDAKGKLLYQVCRFDLGNGKKEFRQRKPNGKDTWQWNLKDTKRVLFNLPEVIKAPDIFCAEGEKDCLSLKQFGFVATCNPGGAGKVPNQQNKYKILDPLTGKNVFILPDNDQPGRDHANEVAELLQGKAKVVKVISLPDLPEGGDVTDFLRRENAKTELIELTALAEPWRPPQLFISAQELEATPLDKLACVIDPFLPERSHLLIAGDAGVGKSLLRLELALYIAMGWSWLGFEVPTSRRCVIMQYENSDRSETVRLRRMKLGLGIRELPKGKLDWLKEGPDRPRFNLTNKGDQAKLLELVKRSEAEVIIYDPLSSFHTSDENKNIALREVLDTFSYINSVLGTSCILIHHFGKSGNEFRTHRSIMDKFRGARSQIDWAASAIGYTKRYHKDRVLRQLDFVKLRDCPEIKPILVERDENFLLERTYEETLCPPDQVAKILKELGGQVKSQKPLAEAIMEDTACSYRSAQTFIRRAVEVQAINEIDHGYGKTKSYEI